MSDVARAMPVQGWYPDPGGPPLLRWWSGADWTAHTLDPMTGQPPVAYKPMQSHTDYASSYSSAAPSSAGSSLAAQRSNAGTSTRTLAIVVIAIYPLLYIATLWTAISVTGQFSLSVSGVVDIAALILLLGMAMWDHAVLEKRGIPGASALWMLLSPIGYLIARRMRLKKNGIKANAPGNFFVLCVLGSYTVSYLVGTPIIERIDDRAAVDTMQTYVATTLASKTSTHWTVSCPEDAPAATVGAVFTCHATDTSGKAVDVNATVVSRDQFTLAIVEAQNTGANT